MKRSTRKMLTTEKEIYIIVNLSWKYFVWKSLSNTLLYWRAITPILYSILEFIPNVTECILSRTKYLRLKIQSIFRTTDHMIDFFAFYLQFSQQLYYIYIEIIIMIKLMQEILSKFG